MSMWKRNAALIVATGLAAACGGAAQQTQAPGTPAAAAREVAGPACQASAGGIAQATSPTGSSSTIVLAEIAGKKIAYVSDEDVHAILTVDVESKKQLASTPVDGVPGHMLLTRDGKLAVVMRDKARVVAFTTGAADRPLTSACAASVAEEPFAMALTPDGKSLLVTSAWGRTLTTLDAASLAKKSDLRLAREPRAVVISDDGKTAFVSHAVGSHMSLVDLSQGSAKELTMRGKDPMMAMQRRVSRFNPKRLKAAGVKVTPEMEQRFSEMEKEEQAKEEESGRVSCQGYALAKTMDPKGRVLAPQVFVDSGDPNQRAEGYGDDDSPTEAPSVAVIDDATGTALDTSACVRARAHVHGWCRRSARSSRALPLAARSGRGPERQEPARHVLRHRRRGGVRRRCGQPRARGEAPLGRGGRAHRHCGGCCLEARGRVVAVRSHHQRDRSGGSPDVQPEVESAREISADRAAGGAEEDHPGDRHGPPPVPRRGRQPHRQGRTRLRQLSPRRPATMRSRGPLPTDRAAPSSWPVAWGSRLTRGATRSTRCASTWPPRSTASMARVSAAWSWTRSSRTSRPWLPRTRR